MTRGTSFESYIKDAEVRGRLVVQPRMGFGRLDDMRRGLSEVKSAAHTVPRVGTVTIDSYTRVGQVEHATKALREGRDLNGFPIVSHGPEATRQMLEGLRDGCFPVQVRHGTAFPQDIFQASAAAGFDAIEGGPVSYNLPYSRAPLHQTIEAWAAACRFWADHGEKESIASHIESFGGCMLGQMCPPSLLVALSILEGRFFVENGVNYLSLSLAQGTNDAQDIGAVIALRRLAEHFLPDARWHVVYYTFMGLFPNTAQGAEALIRASARIAVMGGAQRLIVKTAAEAHGIPTVRQNVDAMGWARDEADRTRGQTNDECEAWADVIAAEAEALVAAVLKCETTVAASLVEAFRLGLLDVPYCTHPDNRNHSRVALDPETKALLWASPGAMPISRPAANSSTVEMNSSQFHETISLNRERYDILHYIPPLERKYEGETRRETCGSRHHFG